MIRTLSFVAVFYLSAATAFSQNDIKHVVVYDEPGRFCGWPANNGAWIWGNEIVVGFEMGHYVDRGKDSGQHARDDRPNDDLLARSLDGGETWKAEKHSILGGGNRTDCPGGIDFTHPDFALRCQSSRFYFSYDRGRSWKGPFRLPEVGEDLGARTDYIANGKHDCFLFLATEDDFTGEDRAFCARTTDGGKTIRFVSWMTPPKKGERSVMPSTVRLSKSHFISAMRRKHGSRRNWIDVYRSEDTGKTWKFLSKVADTDRGGRNGNPPSMGRLKDGRLVVTYGYRAPPYGIRAKVSKDNGKTWGKEIILRKDGRSWDLGYPQTVMRPDGKVVTMYYYTTDERKEQHIAATIWRP